MLLLKNWAKKVANFLKNGLKMCFLGCKWGKNENKFDTPSCFVYTPSFLFTHPFFVCLHTQFHKSYLNPWLTHTGLLLCVDKYEPHYFRQFGIERCRVFSFHKVMALNLWNCQIHCSTYSTCSLGLAPNGLVLYFLG